VIDGVRVGDIGDDHRQRTGNAVASQQCRPLRCGVGREQRWRWQIMLRQRPQRRIAQQRIEGKIAGDQDVVEQARFSRVIDIQASGLQPGPALIEPVIEHGWKGV